MKFTKELQHKKEKNFILLNKIQSVLQGQVLHRLSNPKRPVLDT